MKRVCQFQFLCGQGGVGHLPHMHHKAVSMVRRTAPQKWEFELTEVLISCYCVGQNVFFITLKHVLKIWWVMEVQF